MIENKKSPVAIIARFKKSLLHISLREKKNAAFVTKLKGLSSLLSMNKKQRSSFTYIARRKRFGSWKFALGCVVLILTLCCSGLFMPSVNADNNNNESIEEQLNQGVGNQLGGIDFGSFEEIIQNLSSSAQGFFGGTSFWEKVRTIISGDFSEGFSSFFSAILNAFLGEILGFMPLLATIIAVAILNNLITGLRGGSGSNSVGEITHFVCFGVIVVIVSVALVILLKMTTETVYLLKTQMDAVFPVLLTLLASVGGVVSVGIFQPSVAILSGVVVQIFTSVVIPLFIFIFIFQVVGNISSNVKLDKFAGFFSSAFKWIVGTIFTLFLTFISVQGIVAGVYDGVSVRAAKFAIKSYIPILGGYLADGFNIIMASSVLIKNAIGLAGLLLMFSSIVMPVAKIMVFSLGLKLTAAILEPIADSKISNFVNSVGKLLNYLVAVIMGVAFMYLISIALIMCTANVL